MTDGKAHAYGAAMVAAGALLGVTAALRDARPELAWQPLVIGLSAYAASAALVFRWGMAVYGPPGALAATALAAFAPAVLAAIAAPQGAGVIVLIVGCVHVAAVYALMRCLLDAALSWAVLAGVAIVGVPLGAFAYGIHAAVVVNLAVLSVLLVVGRVLTAERVESRLRVAHASAVAVALAWSIALTVLFLIASFSHLPSVEEYSAIESPAGQHGARAAIVSARTIALPAGRAADAPIARGPSDASRFAALPLAALLLAAARPWRPQRRFTDAGWAAALVCVGVPLWLTWPASGAVFATPIAALLAGACWDVSRPAWARHAAMLVVVMQAAVALLLWPYAPAAERANAVASAYGVVLGAADQP